MNDAALSSLSWFVTGNKSRQARGIMARHIQGGGDMTLAYVESEDRVVDVEAMIRECKALPPLTLEDGQRIIDKIQQEAVANGTAGMSMEEIDEEIAKCRRERKERQQSLAWARVSESSPCTLQSKPELTHEYAGSL